MFTSYKKEIREPNRGSGRKGSKTVYSWSSTLSLRNSNQQEFHYGPSFRIWTCRSRRVKKLPNE